jgi:peptidoglycan hydrolase-like protein with peptidoglycan-binding domain
MCQVYDSETAAATESFQQGNGLPVTGSFDNVTAILLLELHSGEAGRWAVVVATLDEQIDRNVDPI